MVWTCVHDPCDATCDSIVLAGLWKQADLVKQNGNDIKAVEANENYKDGLGNQNTNTFKYIKCTSF